MVPVYVHQLWSLDDYESPTAIHNVSGTVEKLTPCRAFFPGGMINLAQPLIKGG